MSRRVPIFKRCGCTELVDGKRRQLGTACPRLRRRDGTWNPRHGTWTFTAARQIGGKRRPVTRGGFTTYEEAERELAAMREQLSTGRRIDRVTVGQWLDEWIAAKADIKASTRRTYQMHIDTILKPTLGPVRLDELRTASVAEALATVTSSDAYRQRVRCTLRSSLSDAVRESLISTNPAALVKLPSGRRPKALVWTEERAEQWKIDRKPPSAVMVWRADQLGHFLDYIAEHRLYCLFHLISHRALRRGEACGLRWVDVDLAGAKLYVRRQLMNNGGVIHEDTPKSAAGARPVALDEGTVVQLRTWRRRQLEERVAWGEAWTDTGRVFTQEDGHDLNPDLVSLKFRSLCRAAGLPPIKLHGLRHGAASLMLAAGVDLKVVQETLGHSTLAMTADTYTTVYGELAAEAAERSAALIPRAHAGNGARISHTHGGLAAVDSESPAP